MSLPHEPAPRRRLPVVQGPQEVALVSLATEGAYGGRGSTNLIRYASTLQINGQASRLFVLHFDPRQVGENAKRIDELVDRLRARGSRRVVLEFPWAPELTERLTRGGLDVEVMEGTAHNSAQDPFADLPPVEIIGSDPRAGIENVDLHVGQACSYERPVAGDAFYEETSTTHRGCAYCQGASARENVRDVTATVLARVRDYRASLPDLRTIWVPFAETVFSGLTEALDRSVGSELFRGIDLSIQLRPDVMRKREPELRTLGASAQRAGTRIRIALVGFENFSQHELEILHRGVTQEDLAYAARTLGEWRVSPPVGIDVRACVPSFILFNPWTRLEDLEISLEGIRTHRLMAANVERLRISPVMPLHDKLVESGLLDDAAPSLEVHPNGYTGEVGYRFADARVASIARGFATLKPFAMAEQAPLLEAIVRAVRAAPDPSAIDWDAVARAIRELDAVTNARLKSDARRNGASVRAIDRVLKSHGLSLGFAPLEPEPTSKSATTATSEVRVAATHACNNGCLRCVWTRRLDFAEGITLPLTIDVRGKSVFLAGREPTLREDLAEIVAALKAGGAARVTMETNARRLTSPRYVRSLAAAGLDGVLVKLFGATPAAWDAHTEVPGSFEQTLRALAIVTMAAPNVSMTGLVVPGTEPGTRLNELAQFASSLGVPALRAVISVARQDLLAIGSLTEEVRKLGPTVTVHLRTG